MKTNLSAKSSLSGGSTRSNSIEELRLLALGSLVLLVSLSAGCATTPVPTDSLNTCPVSATEFKTWFATGAVSLNGEVKPADSVNFPDLPNCSFYKWSEQMFLWLNSPAPASYGGGERIFISPAFYDVSPPGFYDLAGESYTRVLIPHPAGSTTLDNLSMRAAKTGPHGLPVILDKMGTMVEIQRPQFGPTGKQLILNERGEAVEIERISLGDDKRPMFIDGKNREIRGAKPLLQKELQERKDLNRELIVQKFMVEQNPLFLNLNGNVVVVEQGQADNSVLMAQNGSLVYYQIMVNDVYAYFLTGVKSSGLNPNSKFPTTQMELNWIKQFASNHGMPSPEPFPDPEALAVEIKTAWVEAEGIVNIDTYITMNARIPVYNKVSPQLWVRTNNYKVAKLALVGMSIAGSAAGHRELIWATFEHQDNAPNAKYTYNTISGVNTVNPDFDKAFLFCARNPPLAQLNQSHIQRDPDPNGNPDNLIAPPGFSISASNIIRGNAWGATLGVSPNPIDFTDAASNSELISINNNVRGMLDGGDVRNKYIMTGVTWTINGGVFTDNFGKPGNITTATGTAVGTSQMANATMETFQQALDPTTHQTSFRLIGNNCFSCHNAAGNGVSHIFFDPLTGNAGLRPLF